MRKLQQEVQSTLESNSSDFQRHEQYNYMPTGGGITVNPYPYTIDNPPKEIERQRWEHSGNQRQKWDKDSSHSPGTPRQPNNLGNLPQN
jgi:hypothetical protein